MSRSQNKLKVMTSSLTGLLLVLELLATLLLATTWGWLLNRSAAAEIDYLNKKLALETSLVTQGDQLAADRLLAETAADRELLASYVITSDRIAAALEEMEAAATVSGLDLNILTVAADGRLTVKLEWTGAFGDWFKFLQLVELLPAVVRIDNFSLQPVADPEGSSAGWRGVMTISFLSFIADHEN